MPAAVSPVLDKGALARRELAIREILRRDLERFIRGYDADHPGAWAILELNTPLDWNWHHTYICEFLVDVAMGETRRLLVNVMPRSLKSLFVSIFFPCWVWLRQPWASFLCMSYSTPLANDHSYKRRRVIESEWYQRLSRGRCILSDDRNRITEYSNNSGGVIYARGLDGSVTGLGAEYLLFDDPNNPEKESDVVREGALTKFKNYLTTRANDPKRTKTIVVQQRTHESDVSGYIIKTAAEEKDPSRRFKIVKLPTRAHKNETVVFPRSKTVVERKAGELLHPHRFGEEEDAEAKRDLGAYAYSARHDQEPAPLEGGVFSKAVWQTFTELPARYELIISADLSFGSTSSTASFVSVGLFAIAYPNFYLIDLFHKRCGFNDAQKGIRELINRNEPVYGIIATKLIEKKASGAAMIEKLQEEFPGVLSFNPDEFGSKEQRAQLIAPAFESGNFHIKHGVGWLESVKIEFVKFGVYDTDDIVDMTSQAMIYYQLKMRKRRSPVSSIVQS